jgi:hypothetical protein
MMDLSMVSARALAVFFRFRPGWLSPAFASSILFRLLG